MKAACDAVQELVGVAPGVIGIHFEGPFLSPDKPGVHDVSLIRQPTLEDRSALTAPR